MELLEYFSEDNTKKLGNAERYYKRYYWRLYGRKNIKIGKRAFIRDY